MPGDTAQRIEYDVFALADVRQEKYEILASVIDERLAAFNCAKSDHLQAFARGGVRKWEDHEHSRTYVLVTPRQDTVDVAAFFTVGMTALNLEKASPSMRKKLMGNVSLDQTGAYSIAELARSDEYTSAQLPGSVILDEAKAVISLARRYVAGRFVVVDAREEVFTKLYEPAGFSRIHLPESPRAMQGIPFVIGGGGVIKDW